MNVIALFAHVHNNDQLTRNKCNPICLKLSSRLVEYKRVPVLSIGIDELVEGQRITWENEHKVHESHRHSSTYDLMQLKNFLPSVSNFMYTTVFMYLRHKEFDLWFKTV